MNLISLVIHTLYQECLWVYTDVVYQENMLNTMLNRQPIQHVKSRPYLHPMSNHSNMMFDSLVVLLLMRDLCCVYCNLGGLKKRKKSSSLYDT